jgi:hypothetical protein
MSWGVAGIMAGVLLTGGVGIGVAATTATDTLSVDRTAQALPTKTAFLKPHGYKDLGYLSTAGYQTIRVFYHANHGKSVRACNDLELSLFDTSGGGTSRGTLAQFKVTGTGSRVFDVPGQYLTVHANNVGSNSCKVQVSVDGRSN